MASDVTGEAGGDSGGNSGAQPPMMNFGYQYIKDLSFENPRAPQIFQSDQQPEVSVNVNVGAERVGLGIPHIAVAGVLQPGPAVFDFVDPDPIAVEQLADQHGVAGRRAAQVQGADGHLGRPALGEARALDTALQLGAGQVVAQGVEAGIEVVAHKYSHMGL